MPSYPISKRATRYFIFAVSCERLMRCSCHDKQVLGVGGGPLVLVPGFMIQLSHHVILERQMTGKGSYCKVRVAWNFLIFLVSFKTTRTAYENSQAEEISVESKQDCFLK